MLVFAIVSCVYECSCVIFVSVFFFRNFRSFHHVCHSVGNQTTGFQYMFYKILSITDYVCVCVFAIGWVFVRGCEYLALMIDVNDSD